VRAAASIPRDPEARFTRKRDKTYFGTKAHLAVDEESGLVRQAEMTPANVHDSRLGEALIQGDEQGFFADVSAGMLPAVSFIKPLGPDNEHPGYAALLRGQQHVADLVSAVRTTVERGYTDVWVEGEISNFRPSESGHLYFTLKDGDAQLRIVMFRSQARLLRFRPENGMQVIARGRVTIYDARGELQLSAEFLEPGIRRRIRAVESPGLRCGGQALSLGLPFFHYRNRREIP